MAALYKRYIPPKLGEAYLQNASSSPAKLSNALSEELPGKRKRERTDGDRAARKAKKLRNRGIELTATAPLQSDLSNSESQTHTDYSKVPETSIDTAPPKPKGEFAHIKNAKKRHKLEKQARKARKTNSESVSRDSNNGSREPSVRALAVPVEHPNQEDQQADAEENLVAGQKQQKIQEQYENYGDLQSVKEGFTRGSSPTYPKSNFQEPQAGNQPQPADTTKATTELDCYGVSKLRHNKRSHKLEDHFSDPTKEHFAEESKDNHLQKHSDLLGKFQKSTQLARKNQRNQPTTEGHSIQSPQVQELVLPQADEAEVDLFLSHESTLPKWLSQPIIVSDEDRCAFESLGLEAKTVDQLSNLGFKDALPIQRTLVPMLLPPGTSGSKYPPGTESMVPDLAVSAPTGSGKTIAYLLPILESIKRSPSEGTLRALVVVPTRELVVQVAAVAESLCKGSNLKVGMATGSRNFKEEVAKLITKGRSYNPEAYRSLMSLAHKCNYPGSSPSAPLDSQSEFEDENNEEELQEVAKGLVDHVPTHMSSVDILVATPGRLLEHLRSNKGVFIAHLDYLVLDEADKLLDQQYDGLLRTIHEYIDQRPNSRKRNPGDSQISSETLLKRRRVWKILLSATMTRDISKLIELKLSRPQLIVVRNDRLNERNAIIQARNDGAGHARDVDDLELPPNLTEFCVHAGDGDEKPLYLVETMKRKLIRAGANYQASREFQDGRVEGIDGTEHNDETDSDQSSLVSESNSVSGSESTNSSFENEENAAQKSGGDKPDSIHPARAALLRQPSTDNVLPVDIETAPTVLVFTSSTESANRLSYLLKMLTPEWSGFIATMTRPDSKRRPQVRAKSTEPIIIVSTDRAGRGLDAINGRSITQVVQYDVPRSITNYVHRVGRTARAGRPGEAWTLYTHSEARWFVNEIVRARRIKRAVAVERVKLNIEDEKLRERLDEAVSEMRDQVFGSK